MKFAILCLGVLVTTQSFAAVKSYRKVRYVSPQSFSCYDDANNSSSINFYVGKYVTVNETRTYTEYTYSDSLKLSNNFANICI